MDADIELEGEDAHKQIGMKTERESNTLSSLLGW